MCIPLIKKDLLMDRNIFSIQIVFLLIFPSKKMKKETFLKY